VVEKADESGVEDLLSCDAVCFGTPGYFSYMAGMLKDFFDRTFYRVDDVRREMWGELSGGHLMPD